MTLRRSWRRTARQDSSPQNAGDSVVFTCVKGATEITPVIEGTYLKDTINNAARSRRIEEGGIARLLPRTSTREIATCAQ